MQEAIKDALKTKTFKPTGATGGGCISQGAAFETDDGLVFVKRNDRYKAREMFEGEFASLEAIKRTDAIKVPTPLLVIQDPDSSDAALVMEYLEMRNCRNQSTLGTHLARMHLHNLGRKRNLDYIDQFGFEVPTCCGHIPQDNEWSGNWVHFFIEQRLGYQFQLLQKENRGGNEEYRMWHELKPKIPHFFKGIEIYPSLLHGDLWSGNIAETNDAGCVPVVIDPASFYGHHEYDLGIADMFGGVGGDFYKAYHSVIPKEDGFDDRHMLYQLFHYLNHWNHFGSGYRDQSHTLINKLLKKKV